MVSRAAVSCGNKGTMAERKKRHLASKAKCRAGMCHLWVTHQRRMPISGQAQLRGPELAQQRQLPEPGRALPGPQVLVLAEPVHRAQGPVVRELPVPAGQALLVPEQAEPVHQAREPVGLVHPVPGLAVRAYRGQVEPEHRVPEPAEQERPGSEQGLVEPEHPESVPAQAGQARPASEPERVVPAQASARPPGRPVPRAYRRSAPCRCRLRALPGPLLPVQRQLQRPDPRYRASRGGRFRLHTSSDHPPRTDRPDPSFCHAASRRAVSRPGNADGA